MTIPQQPGTQRVAIPGFETPAAPPPTPQAGPVYATMGHRAGALVVSSLIGLLFVGVLIGLIAGGLASPIEAVIAVDVLSIGYAVLQLVLLGTRGYTVEKRIVGLRVVDADTLEPLGVGRALVRQLVFGLIQTVTLGLGLIIMAVLAANDPRRQAWHDKAVRSVVVRAGSEAARAHGARPSQAPTAPTVPTRTVSAPAPVVAPPPIAPVPAAPVMNTASAMITEVPGVPSHMPVSRIPVTLSVPVPGPTGPSIDYATRAQPLQQRRSFRLTLPDGSTVPLDQGTVLVGRNPTPAPGEHADQLISLSDPEMSVSKTHAALIVGTATLRLIDWHSTNGVVVDEPGSPRRLVAGEPFEITKGTRVVLGSLPLLIDSVFEVPTPGGEVSPSTP